MRSGARVATTSARSTATDDPDPAADLAYKTDQVCGDRTVLRNLGYDPFSFAYPGGAVNNVAVEHHALAPVTRSPAPPRRRPGAPAGGPDAEPIPPVHPFVLRAMSLRRTRSTCCRHRAADAGEHRRAPADTGGWLPIAIDARAGRATPAAQPGTNNGKAIDADALLSSSSTGCSLRTPRRGPTVRTVRDVMIAAPPPLPFWPTAVSLTFDDGLRRAVRRPVRCPRRTPPARPRSTSTPGRSTLPRGGRDDLGADRLPGCPDGNDIGGHTRTHVNLASTSTTYDSKWHEVCDDRARLFAQGFNPVSFAYPEGVFNSAAEGIAKGCGYQSARTAGALSAGRAPLLGVVHADRPLRVPGTRYDVQRPRHACR